MKQDSRKPKHRKPIDRRIAALVVGAVVLVLLIVGIVTGIRLGAARRVALEMERQEAAAFEAEAKWQAEQEAKEAAEKEAQALAEAAEREAREADEAATAAMLAEQSKAANVEDAMVLKDIALLGMPNVNAVIMEEMRPRIICLNAAHESVPIPDLEPIGPGSEEMAPIAQVGTEGQASGLFEYQLTLIMAFKLKNVLEARGYQVIMPRMDNDVAIGCVERARIANENGAEVVINLHAESEADPNVTGVRTISPGSDNLFLTSEQIVADQQLAQLVLSSLCAATGAVNRGRSETNALAELNWSAAPAVSVEMGLMSNRDEDLRMTEESYQMMIVNGIADGIDAFLAK
ncbi:MAG: N-acetylmuramoyl-L-alanine amidase [Lachnospiraceae bacterium]|nr:N-acetylmuramoyl-L-alanine amidase [Lachnospiraceae bacterium]